jgi:hypothetical protein
VFWVKDTHEAQTRSTLELTRLEEHGRNVHLPLELLEQRRGPIDGEERTGTDYEDDAPVAVLYGDQATNSAVRLPNRASLGSGP